MTLLLATAPTGEAFKFGIPKADACASAMGSGAAAATIVGTGAAAKTARCIASGSPLGPTGAGAAATGVVAQAGGAAAKAEAWGAKGFNEAFCCGPPAPARRSSPARGAGPWRKAKMLQAGGGDDVVDDEDDDGGAEQKEKAEGMG